ncbi:hypothetical protein FH972_023872 [Carpinus fangiana]|uniref:AN1-type domain-containing protein n=1 Tax=Carpinus fangiana TaxID=176857 RepID=A0A5N6KX33_9ROSI|nr:hypothetical protein FH972_023872 [Carpinus fangiana]
MSSHNNTDPAEPTSYTRMATAAVGEADLDDIGAHCQASFCNQLDFLPFRCESCRGTFCLDHRSETAHKCPRAGEWARNRARQSGLSSTSGPSAKPTILTHESQCASPQCKTLIDTPLVPGIGCENCNRRYCLKHRLREDHNCSKLTPLGARTGKSDRGLGDALGKLRAWGAAKKAAVSSSTSGSASTASNSTAGAVSRTSTASTTKSSSHNNTLYRIVSPFQSKKQKSKAAEITSLNALKRSAKGDAKVPAEKRVYVRLEAVASSSEGAAGAKIPRADAFYSGEWVVGRVLDMAAKTLQIENVNNRGDGEEKKLRVFWIEGGRLLEFGEKLGAGVSNGDTLVLLRGVGAPVPDLIQM